MKKTIILLSTVIFSIIIFQLFVPKIMTNSNIYEMSSDEFQNALNDAKNHKNDGLTKLLNYYNLVHHDEKSTCIILCEITSFPTAQKGYFRMYSDLNCTQKINCTKNSLNQLMEH